MLMVIKYPGIISGYKAAARFHGFFTKDRLVELNIMISTDQSVILALKFNGEPWLVQHSFFNKLIGNGKIIPEEQQAALPGMESQTYCFTGQGYRAFQAYIRNHLRSIGQAANKERS